jgi:hypothetical protein
VTVAKNVWQAVPVDVSPGARKWRSQPLNVAVPALTGMWLTVPVNPPRLAWMRKSCSPQPSPWATSVTEPSVRFAMTHGKAYAPPGEEFHDVPSQQFLAGILRLVR